MDHFSHPELEYLRERPPLQSVRYMSTVQRLFAAGTPIDGRTQRGTDTYWLGVLDHKWLDPVISLIACYELFRRGTTEEHPYFMQNVLSNLRTYFPGLPDTETIAVLLDKGGKPELVPMMLDGLIAVESRDILPLPLKNLDFCGSWTSWRNAILPLR